MENKHVITIWVPGIPQPGGSKKGFAYFDKDRGRYRALITEDNKKSKPWRQSVEWSAKETIDQPLMGALEFRIIFFMPRPKSHFGTGRNANLLKPSAPYFHTGKPDTTKLIRSTEDALKGIAWSDDCQVADQKGKKIYGARPGALIFISPAEAETTAEAAVNEEIVRRMGMRYL
jgi:Holliday junction resolvase RusA-like endonuclease